MSEIMDLVVIEKKNAMAVFTNNDQLDPLIEAIEKEARSLVPDVTTKKGRDAIASMAHKVARSKTYIDNAGKDLVAELKALPKQIDESRRVVRERLDALKDEVRRPLTEWEAEQERIKAEEAMNAMHAEALEMNIKFDQELAAKFEADHEMALLMDKDIDRERADKAAEAERQRIAREEEIKRQAEEKAKREAEEKHRAEMEASARRIEEQSWNQHYQQLAREEKESELADDMEKGLPLRLLESLCIDELQRRGASKQAISRAFDDDVDFQENMAAHVRYMVEVIARHQLNIEEEQ